MSSLNIQPTFISQQALLINTTIPIVWDLSTVDGILSTIDVMSMNADCISHDIVNVGTQAFGLSTANDADVYMYNIPTSYELDSANANGYYTTGFTELQDITFNKRGTVCMIVANDSINTSNYIVYDINPPFNFRDGKTLRTHNIEGPTRVKSIEISYDGTTIIGLTDDGTNSIISWNMNRYDTTTMYNYQVNSLLNETNDIAVNQDGTQLVTVGNGFFSLYTFDTAYDIQTLTHVYTKIIPEIGYDKTVTVRNDGTTIQLGNYTEIKTFPTYESVPEDNDITNISITNTFEDTQYLVSSKTSKTLEDIGLTYSLVFETSLEVLGRVNKVIDNGDSVTYIRDWNVEFLVPRKVIEHLDTAITTTADLSNSEYLVSNKTTEVFEDSGVSYIVDFSGTIYTTT